MRGIMRIFSLALMLCILLAFSFSVHAIGFDAEEIYESVFVITTESSVGSGFAVGPNSIVTNAHVVENASRVKVSTYEGDYFFASVFAIDTQLDIALLIIPGRELIPLSFSSVDNMKIGDDIYTIGAPNSMAYTLTKGVISAKERVIRNRTYIQIDAAINAGNSGGPLLNDDGEVLGINTLKISDNEGIGLSIPIGATQEYFKKLGLELTVNGTIASELTTPDPAPNEDPTEDIEITAPDDMKSPRHAVTVLSVLLCVSVLINIIFTARYFSSKKPNRNALIVPSEPIDPSERTDFEIEFQD